MNGSVDAANRALLKVSISKRRDSDRHSITAWVDTAFDGHMVLPLQLIRDLALDELAETEAILADGSKVGLDTYLCYIDWFGKRMPLQVVANKGRFPLLGTGLLGTGLLEGRVLHVDYILKTRALD